MAAIIERFPSRAERASPDPVKMVAGLVRTCEAMSTSLEGLSPQAMREQIRALERIGGFAPRQVDAAAARFLAAVLEDRLARIRRERTPLVSPEP
jgi:hypothetical protein